MLINGKVRPVTGSKLVATPMLINAWMVRLSPKPICQQRLKEEGAYTTIRMQPVHQNKNRVTA